MTWQTNGDPDTPPVQPRFRLLDSFQINPSLASPSANHGAIQASSHRKVLTPPTGIRTISDSSAGP